ncbi:prepilin-type N-terminal cleavage/methylation domain-containing protein [Methylocystis parvus]|uniref:Prepilin-type N-terminal cleavage/methylation domain-containing protein n=1 Tax=Methylocystis parvus TaxID=134 RepID=A0A6B8M5H8_9HYPH|nr:prepilin-type N-terminal cleavage/methylation domain-containing protein [Methylocystis parvus]QGM96080.1 prepilin-type N-terminal cleavage/methylation domain-containing protein [Methylocystis parvus]WBK00097.1 prepilin-type N-terminal cleavage/methylation domain-containing protein [Methylocystis parvus OBBP]
MTQRSRDGFTLLELLLAISILSLITVAIMGGIRLGTRAWDTTRASDALDDVEGAIRAAAGLISRGYPVATEQMQQQFTAEGPPPPFAGSANAASFVALSEGGAQWGGLIVTEIGVDAGADGSELAVWTKPYRPREGLVIGRGAMKRTAILKDVAFFELSYFGAQQAQPGFGQQPQPPAWSAAWASRGGLPELVRIRIGANRLGRLVEAEATVAIRQR